MGNRLGFLTVCLLIFLASCFLPLPATGQQLQGSITGTVTAPICSQIPDTLSGTHPITLLVNAYLKIDLQMTVGARTTTVPSSAGDRGRSSSRERISFGFSFRGRQDSDY